MIIAFKILLAGEDIQAEQQNFQSLTFASAWNSVNHKLSLQGNFSIGG